jgi:hypothetical protein
VTVVVDVPDLRASGLGISVSVAGDDNTAGAVVSLLEDSGLPQDLALDHLQ